MVGKSGTYDTEIANNSNLKRILGVLRSFGVNKAYVKKLAPNDNSKNQPYFGSHLTDLSFIPTGDTVSSSTTSNKPGVKSDAKRQIKFQASINLNWVDAEGNVYPAPEAKLIYYPQYPEVRFSGFLKGSKVQLSHWMDPYKGGRSDGRWLILGVSENATVYSYLVPPASSLSKELSETKMIGITPIFSEITFPNFNNISTRSLLIDKVNQIHEMGWIPGQKLNSVGEKCSYRAPNAGGYTLEAELDVAPNGVAEPDYLGWEVKQFSVKAFPARGTSPTTLLTPEPNGGLYFDMGAQEFTKRYGYPDKNGIPDRLNFGGKHQVGKVCNASNLSLQLLGFDHENGRITDAQGCVALLDQNEEVTASWSYTKLMDHWKRKHSQAVYIPCLRRSMGDGSIQYHYGKDIELGVGTNFVMLLNAMSKGHVYYDPGIKLENVSTNRPKIKKRSQFRIKHAELNSLYKKYEFVDVTK